MIVLSLFDGISCGRVALERAGIPVTKYYTSEIDKYAIQISKKNYSDIIQLGDINSFEFGFSKIPLYSPDIDLIIGGSPCQGFSFAGKQLAFDDPRSALFFKYVEILKYYKPKYFLLENVRMKKEHLQVITDALGVEPICINSALVSAQNRIRYYWTNIPGVTQPIDKRIQLVDILEDVGRGTMIKQLAHGYNKGFEKEVTKAPSLTSSGWQYNNLIKCGKQLIFKGGLEKGLRLRDGKKLSRNYREGYRIYGFEGKAATLTSQSKGGPGGYSGLYGELNQYRKLTPIECERLQTLPDNYTEGVSNTQRYKALGNAWTVDVVAHLFKGLKK